MKVRLVAYRKATTASTSDTTYQLDLQEAPNVALNFQFSDVKEPETRKASYSQTFKLPFTQNNNQFFENWYNVNLETLVFSTTKKFNAVLYVGTVPQFEGSLQLKAVYQKAQYYEVILMSNTADLFSAIGEQKLKDVFLQSDGSYSDSLNHLYNAANIRYSWNGGTTSFQNTSGDSLRDAVAGVQKVIYPITATMKNFFYQANSNEYLAMSSIGANAANFMADINQLRPAIQLKQLLRLIIAKAGFSYTSTFIDDDPQYFGKLFMTTCNHLEEAVLPTAEAMPNIPGGSMSVYGSDYLSYGFIEVPLPSPGNCEYFQNGPEFRFRLNSTYIDGYDVWNTTNDVFHKTSPTMLELTIRGNARKSVVAVCGGSPTDVIPIEVKLREFSDGVYGNILSIGTINNITGGGSSSGAFTTQQWEHVIDISNIEVGTKFAIFFVFPEIDNYSAGNQARLQMQRSYINVGGIGNVYGNLTCSWLDYTPSQYGYSIDVPACIDPEITQRGFLKDIIERFNLVILADPDNASNIIIETYDDYIGSGSLKDWTGKLDTSKEVVVKDTTSLQKRIINLTDLEDVDLMNKAIKERAPLLNVYGKYYDDTTSNDFASGELKNTPIFSPYINEQIYRNQDTGEGTDLANMAIQYEISYSPTEFGVENVLHATKPKLFFYNGAETEVLNNIGEQVSYYLHHISPADSTVTAYGFDAYPVCTVWDITPSSGAYTLSPSNKSLYWNFAPPPTGGSGIFNYTPESPGFWNENTLFFLYWRSYLNNIYNSDARIMECHLNLNEVDIFNFKFSDEIFIKDSYWRIINIQNYQVGDKVSTKVILLKLLDSLYNVQDCNSVAVGMYGGFLSWCSENDPDCSPDTSFPNYPGLYASSACCLANGGMPLTNFDNGTGEYYCIANSGSLPATFQSQKTPLSLFSIGQLQTLVSGNLGGLNSPFIRGVDTSKYSQKILPYIGDDMVIKYKTKLKGIPQINGESHTMVLTGHTEGNTRGYAYPEGSASSTKIIIPPNSNMMVRVYGISTVIGGSSSTYPPGDTESFNYNTAFKRGGSGVSQIGAAGGVVSWAIKDTTTTSTLYISASATGEIQFGLDDSQTDTKKSWALNIDIVVQRIPYITMPYNEEWALFQNGEYIVLENNSYLIWN